MSYLTKNTIKRFLNAMNVRGGVDDAMPTLRNRLNQVLNQKGFSGNHNSKKQIREFINKQNVLKEIEYGSTHLSSNDITLPKDFNDARRVISFINGRALPGQSYKEYKPGKRTFLIAENAREFTIDLTEQRDLKLSRLWDSIMKPLLDRMKGHSEWMIVSVDDRQDERYHMINVDNVMMLEQAFNESGLINYDKATVDNLDDVLDSALFFGRHIAYLQELRFYDITDYSGEKRKIYGKTRKQHFFPFIHHVPFLDLSLYQIYNNKYDCREQEHCVVHSLRYYGHDVSARIPSIYQKSTAIKDLDLDICLRVPNGKDNNYIGNKHGKIKLVSYMDHCMVDKKVAVTKFYLQNYHAILKDRRNTIEWPNDKLLQICGFDEEGNYRTGKNLIENKIETVIDNLELEPVSMWDLLYKGIHKPDLTIGTRDIKIEECNKKIILVNSIPINPNKNQLIYKHKAIKEETANTILKDYHALFPGEISLNEFKSFVNKIPFDIIQANSYAGISHNLFLKEVYSQIGVKEICGSVLDELDKFRRGGIFYAQRLKINEPVISLDVNSLFAHVMKDVLIPIGDPVIGEEALKKPVFYARVLIDGKEELINNIVGICDYQQLLFAIGWEAKTSEKLAEIINLFYEYRQKYKGTKYEKFFKGLLCCPYGKTMTNNYKLYHKIVPKEKAHDYLTQKSKTIHSFRMYDEDNVIFYNYKQFNQYSLLHVGLQVVEAARKYMTDIIDKIKVRVPYCQIDSILLTKRHYKLVKDLLPISNKMGDFKVEYTANCAYILGKGSYLLYNNYKDYKLRLVGKSKEYIERLKPNIQDYFENVI